MTSLTNDHHDLQDRLSAELHESAADLPVTGDPAHAIARARQRQQRRTTATVAAGVVAIGGLTLGALTLRAPAQTAVVAASGDGTTSDAATVGSLSLEWRTADADVDWPIASFVGADGFRYALSTAPGTRFSDASGDGYTPVPQAIYRTTDGEHWDVIDQDGPRLGGLYTRDGVMYSVSTSTDTNGEIVNRVLRSDDSGAAWSGVDVPLDFGTVTDPNGLLFPEGTPSLTLAVGDDQLIATAVRYRWFDDQQLAAFLGHAGDSVYSEILDDGSGGRKVVLRDYTECEAAWASQQATPPTTMAPSDGDTMAETTPEPCMQPTIVAEASFGELGIEGDLIESAAAISTDGVTWSPATIPGAQVWFAGGVFVAADHSQTGQASYFRSANGTDWSPIAIDSADSLDIIGTTNGTLVARMYRGESMTDSIALSSDGGSTWRELTTNDLAPGLGNTSYIATAAAGDLGIVVVLGTDTGNGDRPMEWTIATSGDGSTWSTDDAEAGDIGNGYPSWAFVDADRIGVVFGGAKRGADDSVLAVTLLGTPQR